VKALSSSPCTAKKKKKKEREREKKKERKQQQQMLVRMWGKRTLEFLVYIHLQG
jgi:hypothetical protein